MITFHTNGSLVLESTLESFRQRNDRQYAWVFCTVLQSGKKALIFLFRLKTSS